MRNYPDADDAEDLENLKAEPWMVALLKLNPSYTLWGPREDYMSKEGQSWDSRVLYDNWTGNQWTLDGYNECANFYFRLVREAVTCTDCEQTGYNPATKQVADDFYDFAGRGTRWRDAITEDEVDALWEHHRLGRIGGGEKPTAVEVNRANVRGQFWNDFDHDAINRWILVETRAKRLGVWGLCETCHGEGSVYTADRCEVRLILWMLHPRKGCSRGVEYKNIQREELPEILTFLRTAAERNAERFAGATTMDIASIIERLDP